MEFRSKIESILNQPIDTIEVNPQSGMNNRTYILHTAGGDYLYRQPCAGTEFFADRNGEALAYQRLAPYGICDQPLYIDSASGEKLTPFFPNSHTCNAGDSDDVHQALMLLRRLHNLPVRLQNRPDLFSRVSHFGAIAERAHSPLRREISYSQALNALSGVRFLMDNQPQVPIHGDALPGNFLFPGNHAPILIDLEFASMGCIYEDLADFCHDAGYSPRQSRDFLDAYLDRPSTDDEVRRLWAHMAAVALMWSGWAAFKAEQEVSDRDFFNNYKAMSIACAQSALSQL